MISAEDEIPRDADGGGLDPSAMVDAGNQRPGVLSGAPGERQRPRRGAQYDFDAFTLLCSAWIQREYARRFGRQPLSDQVNEVHIFGSGARR